MSARQIYAITCDAEECPARFEHNERTALATRAAAKPLGWTYQAITRPHGGPAKSIDMCPKHGKPNA